MDPTPDVTSTLPPPGAAGERRWGRGTRRFVLAAVLIGVLGVGAMAAFWVQARTAALPGPTANAVATAFLGDRWRAAATPELVAALDDGAVSPLVGSADAWDALGVRVTSDPASAVYRAGDAETEDTQRADEALVPVTTTYAWKGGTATSFVRLHLTRSFTYAPDDTDDARRPTAVTPWRVDEVRDGSVARSTGVADATCDSPAEAVRQLADAARRDGTLTTGCAMDGSTTANVVGDLSGDAIAAAFPVYNSVHLPDDIVRGTGPGVADRAAVQYVVPVGEGTVIVSIVRVENGWAVLGVTDGGGS
ncbi:hypothetical protein [Microbacterium gorillae]|uniref:hypothetical protein n=1 Tax=Microbacterium gorillae TaxID=1231063 RepID=UPI000590BD7D|nr:hypothetical protein [Microbacterium gorillae]